MLLRIILSCFRSLLYLFSDNLENVIILCISFWNTPPVLQRNISPWVTSFKNMNKHCFISLAHKYCTASRYYHSHIKSNCKQWYRQLFLTDQVVDLFSSRKQCEDLLPFFPILSCLIDRPALLTIYCRLQSPVRRCFEFRTWSCIALLLRLINTSFLLIPGTEMWRKQKNGISGNLPIIVCKHEFRYCLVTVIRQTSLSSLFYRKHFSTFHVSMHL